MKDTLAEFIKDYNDGIITIGDLQRRLSFDQWKKDTRPLPADYIRVPRSPEEIYFTKLDRMKQIDYLAKLKTKVSPVDWKIICMIACGFTQKKVAEKLGFAQSTICKHLYLLADTYPDLRAVLHLCDDDIQLHTNEAKPGSSYPMDEAMHGRDENGRKKCFMPEYLAEQDCKSLCLYCENCTRKRVNKEN